MADERDRPEDEERREDEPTEEDLDELIRRRREEMPEETIEDTDLGEIQPPKFKPPKPNPPCPECSNEMTWGPVPGSGDPPTYRMRCEPCELAAEHEAQQKRLREQLYGESELPKRLQEMSLVTFDPDRFEDAATALSACMRYASHRPLGEDGRGMAIHGNSGTGKTHLAAAIMLAALEQQIPSLFISMPTLLDRMRREFDDAAGQREWLQKAKTARFLVLDDLGAHNATAWADEVLFLIVNHRWGEMLPTVITTNMPPSQLADVVGARTVSRLGEMCEWVALYGPDQRMRRR